MLGNTFGSNPGSLGSNVKGRVRAESTTKRKKLRMDLGESFIVPTTGGSIPGKIE